jgi:hypothetical protein
MCRAFEVNLPLKVSATWIMVNSSRMYTAETFQVEGRNKWQCCVSLFSSQCPPISSGFASCPNYMCFAHPVASKWIKKSYWRAYSGLLLGRCLFRPSTGTTAILIEMFHGFLQSFHGKDWLKTTSIPTLSTSTLIWRYTAEGVTES